MNPDAHTLTGAYALDALGDAERREFEAHLAGCPDCAREVDELRATAARLGLSAAVEPPERLRQRVLARVVETRQEPPLGAPVPPRAAAAPRGGGRLVRLTAAAAVVAAAVAVALGAAVTRAEHERDLARGEVAELRARYDPLAQLAAAPDVRAGAATGVDGGSALVLVSRGLNRAVLVTSDLPEPPAGRTYQAWLIAAGGPPRPAGFLASAAPGTAAPLVLTDLADAARIGLTVEPAGGSPQPTTTPVVLVDVPT